MEAEHILRKVPDVDTNNRSRAADGQLNKTPEVVLWPAIGANGKAAAMEENNNGQLV